MTRVLLIIPAYNEEKNILHTVQQVQLGRELLRERFQLDYIVINDGSRDRTAQVCREHGIPCLNLIQNLGIGGAVQCGYQLAEKRGYDIAVQFDGDGQHDIASLPELVAPIMAREADFVVGSRFIGAGENFHSTAARRLGISFLSRVIRVLTGAVILDVTSGYRAAGKRVIRRFAANYPSDYPEPETLVTLLVNRFRIMEVPAHMFERREGVSSIGRLSAVYYMVKETLAILFAAGKARKSAQEDNT